MSILALFIFLIKAEVFSRSMCGELLFPSLIHVQSAGSLVRQVTIPTMFRSAAEYKNILTAAVTGEAK